MPYFGKNHLNKKRYLQFNGEGPIAYFIGVTGLYDIGAHTVGVPVKSGEYDYNIFNGENINKYFLPTTLNTKNFIDGQIASKSDAILSGIFTKQNLTLSIINKNSGGIVTTNVPPTKPTYPTYDYLTPTPNSTTVEFGSTSLDINGLETNLDGKSIGLPPYQVLSSKELIINNDFNYPFNWIVSNYSKDFTDSMSVNYGDGLLKLSLDDKTKFLAYKSEMPAETPLSASIEVESLVAPESIEFGSGNDMVELPKSTGVLDNLKFNLDSDSVISFQKATPSSSTPVTYNIKNIAIKPDNYFDSINDLWGENYIKELEYTPCEFTNIGSEECANCTLVNIPELKRNGVVFNGYQYIDSRTRIGFNDEGEESYTIFAKISNGSEGNIFRAGNMVLSIFGSKFSLTNLGNIKVFDNEDFSDVIISSDILIELNYVEATHIYSLTVNGRTITSDGSTNSNGLAVVHFGEGFKGSLYLENVVIIKNGNSSSPAWVWNGKFNPPSTNINNISIESPELGYGIVRAKQHSNIFINKVFDTKDNEIEFCLEMVVNHSNNNNTTKVELFDSLLVPTKMNGASSSSMTPITINFENNAHYLHFNDKRFYLYSSTSDTNIDENIVNKFLKIRLVYDKLSWKLFLTKQNGIEQELGTYKSSTPLVFDNLCIINSTGLSYDLNLCNTYVKVSGNIWWSYDSLKESKLIGLCEGFSQISNTYIKNTANPIYQPNSDEVLDSSVVYDVIEPHNFVYNCKINYSIPRPSSSDAVSPINVIQINSDSSVNLNIDKITLNPETIIDNQSITLNYGITSTNANTGYTSLNTSDSYVLYNSTKALIAAGLKALSQTSGVMGISDTDNGFDIIETTNPNNMVFQITNRTKENNGDFYLYKQESENNYQGVTNGYIITDITLTVGKKYLVYYDDGTNDDADVVTAISDGGNIKITTNIAGIVLVDDGNNITVTFDSGISSIDLTICELGSKIAEFDGVVIPANTITDNNQVPCTSQILANTQYFLNDSSSDVYTSTSGAILYIPNSSNPWMTIKNTSDPQKLEVIIKNEDLRTPKINSGKVDIVRFDLKKVAITNSYLSLTTSGFNITSAESSIPLDFGNKVCSIELSNTELNVVVDGVSKGILTYSNKDVSTISLKNSNQDIYKDSVKFPLYDSYIVNGSDVNLKTYTGWNGIPPSYIKLYSGDKFMSPNGLSSGGYDFNDITLTSTINKEVSEELFNQTVTLSGGATTVVNVDFNILNGHYYSVSIDGSEKYYIAANSQISDLDKGFVIESVSNSSTTITLNNSKFSSSPKIIINTLIFDDIYVVVNDNESISFYRNILVSDTTPSNTKVLWRDTVANRYKIHNGSAWIEVNSAVIYKLTINNNIYNKLIDNNNYDSIPNVLASINYKLLQPNRTYRLKINGNIINGSVDIKWGNTIISNVTSFNNDFILEADCYQNEPIYILGNIESDYSVILESAELYESNLVPNGVFDKLEWVYVGNFVCNRTEPLSNNDGNGVVVENIGSGSISNYIPLVMNEYYIASINYDGNRILTPKYNDISKDYQLSTTEFKEYSFISDTNDGVLSISNPLFTGNIYNISVTKSFLKNGSWDGKVNWEMGDKWYVNNNKLLIDSDDPNDPYESSVTQDIPYMLPGQKWVISTYMKIKNHGNISLKLNEEEISSLEGNGEVKINGRVIDITENENTLSITASTDNENILSAEVYNIVMRPLNLCRNTNLLDSTYWTVGGSTVISNGFMNINSISTTSTTQALKLINNDKYDIEFTITDYVMGEIRVGLDNNYSEDIIGNGVHKVTLECDSGAFDENVFSISSQLGFEGKISNIKITPHNLIEDNEFKVLPSWSDGEMGNNGLVLKNQNINTLDTVIYPNQEYKLTFSLDNIVLLEDPELIFRVGNDEKSEEIVVEDLTDGDKEIIFISPNIGEKCKLYIISRRIRGNLRDLSITTENIILNSNFEIKKNWQFYYGADVDLPATYPTKWTIIDGQLIGNNITNDDKDGVIVYNSDFQTDALYVGSINIDDISGTLLLTDGRDFNMEVSAPGVYNISSFKMGPNRSLMIKGKTGSINVSINEIKLSMIGNHATVIDDIPSSSSILTKNMNTINVSDVGSEFVNGSLVAFSVGDKGYLSGEYNNNTISFINREPILFDSNDNTLQPTIEKDDILTLHNIEYIYAKVGGDLLTSNKAPIMSEEQPILDNNEVWYNLKLHTYMFCQDAVLYPVQLVARGLVGITDDGSVCPVCSSMKGSEKYEQINKIKVLVSDNKKLLYIAPSSVSPIDDNTTNYTDNFSICNTNLGSYTDNNITQSGFPYFTGNAYTTFNVPSSAGHYYIYLNGVKYSDSTSLVFEKDIYIQNDDYIPVWDESKQIFVDPLSTTSMYICEIYVNGSGEVTQIYSIDNQYDVITSNMNYKRTVFRDIKKELDVYCVSGGGAVYAGASYDLTNGDGGTSSIVGNGINISCTGGKCGQTPPEYGGEGGTVTDKKDTDRDGRGGTAKGRRSSDGRFADYGCPATPTPYVEGFNDNGNTYGFGGGCGMSGNVSGGGSGAIAHRKITPLKLYNTTMTVGRGGYITLNGTVFTKASGKQGVIVIKLY